MGFIKDCYTAFMLGYTGEYKGEKIDINYLIGKEPEPIKPETPYYIDLELKAIQDQIRVNAELISQYRWKEELSIQDEKKLYWKKKRIDLEYKQSQLDKKQYKLIEKYNLED
jgi:hypothetical protein